MTSTRQLDADATGLGLRRGLLGSLQSVEAGAVDFLECAPENWIGIGGRLGDSFHELLQRFPLVCHGLSLSLGGVAPFDQTYLARLRRFLDAHEVRIYSEHLSYCADDGQMYDLMPLPFTAACVRHVVARIDEVQQALGRRLAIENVSYYAAPYQVLAETDFINEVLSRSDCELLLDVNNIVVNSINHGYDALEFLHALPASRVAYIHVAGHFDEADDLKVDTHGAPVKQQVWDLLEAAYQHCGPRPTLLERDFNFPPMVELLAELAEIRTRLAAATENPSRLASAHEFRAPATEAMCIPTSIDTRRAIGS